MDRSHHPRGRGEAAGAGADFTDFDLDPETFRRLGYRAVDMMAESYRGIREAPVFPPRTSREVEQVFAEPLPETGQDPEDVLEEWRTRVLPNTTQVGSPRYFGFVNGSGSMIAALAEALAASVNMNAGAWKPGPAATEIERRAIAWIAQLIGYPADCGGLFVSGGTMANLTALTAALRNLAPYDTTREGLQRAREGGAGGAAGTAPGGAAAPEGRFTVYVSDHEGHVSVVRAADVMNLGREAVRPVASRPDFTLDPDALARAVREDRARGDRPFCVVAQVGSINVGAVDPLPEIAALCREENLWFHADGACGAVGAMLPEKRHLLRGLELADSVTIDPHKWLYIPYECGCLLVRDAEKLRRSFSMSAPYLRGSLPTEYTGLDYYEYGPQMSRGFRALKVWMTMKHYGAEGYRTLLRQNLRCAEHLDRLVRASRDFEAFHEPTLFIYSFRYVPEETRAALAAAGTETRAALDARLDDLNQRIVDEMQLSGLAFLMTTRIRGRVALRFSICSHRTTIADIDIVFAGLRELGERLAAQSVG